MARGVTPRRPAKNGRHEGVAGKRHAVKDIPKAKALRQFSTTSAHAAKTAGGRAKPSNNAKDGAAALVRAKGYNPVAPERISEILKRLDQLYPNVTCALTHRNPWELLVATILSAQCTDKRVNEVTPGLFKKYPTPADFAAVKPEVLAQDIRSTGFFNNKAKSIVGAAKKITSEFGGNVPRTIEELLTVPGAARKTANVVLGTAYGIATGVVVDTHVT